MNKEEFIKECEKLRIILDEKNLEDLNIYKDLLIEWNNKFNLTTIIEKKEVYLKHFYDSLCLIHGTDLNNKKICDFGTGAGFPGMVIGIIFKNSNVTLIESNAKKVLFLNEVKNRLNLNNITIINDRIENFAKKNREIFDIVTCRAVSHLNIILELSVAILKINGLFIPMKAIVDEEFNESIDKARKLGYEFNKKIEYRLPIENAKRTILIYKKIIETDKKYPREYNIIKKDNVKK